MIWGFILILVGFFLGVMTVFVVEGLAAFFILKQLKKKNEKTEAIMSSAFQVDHEPDNDQSLDYVLKKEGFIWLLESDKIPKGSLEKAFKEKRKKDYVDVYPVRKYGKVEGNSLLLLEPGGLASTIQLKGCTVISVSGSILPSRKWEKRLPIKLESKNLMYNGNKILYIFLDSSWDKESWCKALRLASCDEEEKLHWFSKLHDEFSSYLASLNAGYRSFMTPALGVNDQAEQTVKPDGSSSKVHRFWRRFSRKTSSASADNKSNSNSHSGQEERRNIEKLRHCQDAALTTGMMRAASTSKPSNICSDGSMAPSASSSFAHAETHCEVSINSDADPDEKFVIDEGTLCWNLLMSRLFFDAKGNSDINRSLKALVQEKLSNMRTPSYIGEVVCMNIDMGSLPPHIVSMKVLPMEMDKVWAIDLDIEYSGGILFDIETRLEVRELDRIRGSQSNTNTSTADSVSPDLLEGIKHFKPKLNPEEGLEDVVEPKDDANTVSINRTDSVSSTPYRSRWKCILNSIAEQVSQVPLSLAIRVASLKGTLRLHIKPPPSDQLWYCFTSMPDIEFNLESSIGERKISNVHVALYLVNRFKAVIHETLVFPNWRSHCIPWMIAEKDDWVPQTAAPYTWRHHESRDEGPTPGDALDHRPSNTKRKPELTRSSTNVTESILQKSRTSDHNRESILKSSYSFSHPPRTNNSSTLVHGGKSLQDLKTPLIRKDTQEEESIPHNIITLECPSSSNRSFGGVSDREDQTIEQDDSRSKKLGRMEKMMDLRKKMGEKFEKKKRHFEEKSRSIVERMRNSS